MKKSILMTIYSLLFFFLTSISLNATIVILISTYDGFIIVADSRLTLSDKERDRIASDSFQKIIRIGYSGGLAFTGAGLLVDRNNQKRSIGSLIEDFKIIENISDTTRISPKIICDRLKSYFEQIYNSHMDNVLEGNLEIIVFGYDEQNKRKLFLIVFSQIETSIQGNRKINGIMTEIYASGTPGSFVLGQQDVWHRIIKGYDPMLSNVNISAGLKDSLRYNIRYDLMTLQDGIDFAVFIARATIEAQRFNQKSVMGVGGAIDVAIITTNGFEWIQKKRLNVEGKEYDFR